MKTVKTFLSTPAEIHAFGIGVYHGIMPHKGIPRSVQTGNEDVNKEIHYAKGGYVAGETGKYAGIFMLGGGPVACLV